MGSEDRTIRRLVVVSWLVLATVLLQLAGPGMVWAGGRCPEMKGSSNPSDPSHVIQTFVDLLGCDVPLRQGVAHTPKLQGDFGLAHILARYQEGATNHESTPAAKVLWQRALLQAGAVRGPLYECHYVQYEEQGRKRTMKVLVDYKSFRGYAYRGIVTAYWVSGHQEC